MYVYVTGNYWKKFIHKTSKTFIHVHKYSNDLMSIIITLGTYVNGGEIVFLNGFTMKKIGKRAHVS